MRTIEHELALIGRRFIGGYRARPKGFNKTTWQSRTGYREIARRLRQDIRKIAKSIVVVETFYTTETLWDQLRSDPEAYNKFRTASIPALREIRETMLREAGR